MKSSKTPKSPALLIDGFINSLSKFPNRPALDVDNKTYTYKELAASAERIAKNIRLNPKHQTLIGILAHKSETAFAGILGALLSGNGYAPLQPHHPIDRTLLAIKIAKIETIVVGIEAIDCLEILIQKIDHPIRFIVPLSSELEIKRFKSLDSKHLFSNIEESDTNDTSIVRPNNSVNDIAYVIFTSGSTGSPKGVVVRNKNVVSFVQYMARRCDANHHDRFSQISDLTFDLSIFPVWTCWESGACLCCVSDKSKLAPSKVIKEKQITVWTSVPSMVTLFKKMRLIKADAYPSIRYTFFCGEALSTDSANDWQIACPNSRIENMYGPTEATCAITGFEWTGDESRCTNNIVPIGWAFDNQNTAIVDHDLKPVPRGVEGELCLSGSQVVENYLKDPTKTSEKFVKITILNDELWYKTGDLAIEADDGCLFFRGRADFQVKILGHRIELEEVEHTVRKSTNAASVVCLPWPFVNGAAQGLVVFATESQARCDERMAIRACENSLPNYMVPKRIHFIPTLPLNANGKTDRSQLTTMLEEGAFE